MNPKAQKPHPEERAKAIRDGDRRALARAITQIESRHPVQAELGRATLEALMPHTGAAQRVGITGPPGVGKSTFIEALGLSLIEAGHRVAVLAVDPSSPSTGGSILGDKTRMELLAQREEAYIRPSPSGSSLGGVAHRTRETILLCEAAGFDVVLVETVGIGQSEVTLSSMVDFFLVLVQPGAGDMLQGIKKGVIELADALLIHKADGPQLEIAKRSSLDYEQALMLLRAQSPNWRPPVLRASSVTGDGIKEAWEIVERHRKVTSESGERDARRREQARVWMWSLVEEGLRDRFRSHPDVSAMLEKIEADVEASQTSPAVAARTLLDAFEN